MRIAKVIGTVTLSRCHPSLTAARWIIGVPYSLKSLRDLPTLREYTELSEESRRVFESELGEPAPEGPLHALVGLRLPTGSANPNHRWRAANGTTILSRDPVLQPGYGTLDPILGLQWAKALPKGRSLYLGTLYRQTSGRNDYGYRFGNEFQATLGASLPLGRRIVFSPQLFAQVSAHDYDFQPLPGKHPGQVANTGGRWLYFMPNLRVGALQFVAVDDDHDDLADHRIAGDVVDDAAIEKLLKGLAQTPLGLTREDDFRISVAGAQEKPQPAVFSIRDQRRTLGNQIDAGVAIARVAPVAAADAYSRLAAIVRFADQQHAFGNRIQSGSLNRPGASALHRAHAQVRLGKNRRTVLAGLRKLGPDAVRRIDEQARRLDAVEFRIQIVESEAH